MDFRQYVQPEANIPGASLTDSILWKHPLREVDGERKRPNEFSLRELPKHYTCSRVPINSFTLVR